jgi:hypothetical protein
MCALRTQGTGELEYCRESVLCGTGVVFCVGEKKICCLDGNSLLSVRVVSNAERMLLRGVRVVVYSGLYFLIIFK